MLLSHQFRFLSISCFGYNGRDGSSPIFCMFAPKYMMYERQKVRLSPLCCPSALRCHGCAAIRQLLSSAPCCVAMFVQGVSFRSDCNCPCFLEHLSVFSTALPEKQKRQLSVFHFFKCVFSMFGGNVDDISADSCGGDVSFLCRCGLRFGFLRRFVCLVPRHCLCMFCFLDPGVT